MRLSDCWEVTVMVVREWSGTVRAGDAPAYLELMRRHALPDYRAVPGNLAAQVWHRPDGPDLVRFVTVSWWVSRDAIVAFAGADIETARYYDFDDRYLVDRGPRVRHYDAEAGDQRAESYDLVHQDGQTGGDGEHGPGE